MFTFLTVQFYADGPSDPDLLATLKELEARRVSVVALNGMTFDLATPHGRMMATVLAGIAEFELEARGRVAYERFLLKLADQVEADNRGDK